MAPKLGPSYVITPPILALLRSYSMLLDKLCAFYSSSNYGFSADAAPAELRRYFFFSL